MLSPQAGSSQQLTGGTSEQQAPGSSRAPKEFHTKTCGVTLSLSQDTQRDESTARAQNCRPGAQHAQQSHTDGHLETTPEVTASGVTKEAPLQEDSKMESPR